MKAVPARAGWIALARVLNTTFFFATSIYCLLKYSPFTNEQFIKPNVSAALTNFAVWHADLHWLVLSVTALTLAPFLERSRAKWIGWAYLAASAVLGLWLFTHPLWLQPGTSSANLILAIVASVPPIWLAVFDHVSTSDNRGARGGRGANPVIPESAASLIPGVSSATRMWTACWVTAAVVFAVYATAALVRISMTGGIALSIASVATGWAVSAVAHVTAFTLVFLGLTVVAGLASLARAPGRAEYWLLWACSAAATAMTLLRVMLAPIAIRGPAAWAVSISIAVALASTWSGIAAHRRAWRDRDRSRQDAAGTESGLDAWLSPLALDGSWGGAAIGVLAAALGTQVIIARVATFDWEFMLQKLATLAFWLVAFAFLHARTRDRIPRRPLWVSAALVLAIFAGEQVLLPRVQAFAPGTRLNPEFALDGYAAVDPSFRIARDMLGTATAGDAAGFYTYLRENAGIQKALGPVDIDFVDSWKHGGERPPHLFLFIVDSLRRDYVSPYNAAVTFTPAFAAFAEDSFVFRRAFSRYAGTGLAVPSIWAGAMLVHKQYVTPFAATNALEKLVAAKGYQRLITEDHITDELFSGTPDSIGLDHQVPEMLHTFCRTMGEVGARLEHYDGSVPLFVMTRPLDLHIGNIASATTPAGETYPGFYGPYAARVKRIDSCFGEFIATLKRLHLYDDSVIVVTADHGDSLGEGQRWGHGFTAFPEVLRIPLIVHVPPSRRAGLSADLARVTLSTDITPTLYTLAGEPPTARAAREPRDLLIGSSLFVDPAADRSWRRRESYLVASSYGPVFGLLSQNGRRLYVADGVESREYAYDLHPDGTDVRVGITDAERQASRQAIRDQVADLAAWYRFTPGP